MQTKKILIGILFVFLGLPLFNTLVPFIKSGALKGAIIIAPDTSFTWKGWFEGTYQKQKEAYHNSNVSFYPDFIRINNQIDFSLFGILHARDVIEGENHYLYEIPYIESYLGKDKMNDSIILNDSKNIKLIQDSLTARGKLFLFVIATNKADYYTEYLPKKYKKIKKSSRNYDKYLHYFDSLGISYIDFNGYFVRQKSKSPYPLITKFGTHWSSYGVAVATDSIIRYFNLRHYKNQLIQPKISYTESMKYNKHDKESFDPLNLIAGWSDKELTAWPEYKYSQKIGTLKPKILFVSDSYFWEIYDQKVIENVFSDFEFWYYNREHWKKDHKLLGDAATDKNLGNKYLEKTDIVIMMSSEFHLNSVTNDFMKKIKK